MLRRILGVKRDEITGESRKLHIEELNNLYCSTNIVWETTSRRMRWAAHVERMGVGEAYTGFWCGNMRERDHLGYQGIDGSIILRWTFSKLIVLAWTGLSWISIGTDGGHL